MAYKQPSSGPFKMMGSSPAKRAGIFEGEGIDRVRISKDEAARKEASGATNITRTALDNPDKKEGAQQVKNLKKYHADIDADLQVRKNADEGKTGDGYRNYDENMVHGFGDSGMYTTKAAEKDIREHENVVGGDPSVTEGKRQYQVNGEWIDEDEYNKLPKPKKKKNIISSSSSSSITTKKGKPTTKKVKLTRTNANKNKSSSTASSTTTYKPGKPMTGAEYRALLKRN